MDLTAEAINRIIQLHREQEPIIMAPDFAASGLYYLRHPDGSLEDRRATFPPANIRMRDTASFCAAIQEAHNIDWGAKVFCGDRSIDAALVHPQFGAGTYGARLISLPLPEHPAFGEIRKLLKTTPFTQRTLIRFLRADLNGHVDPATVSLFRDLRLRASDEGRQVQAANRQAVDRSITAAVESEMGQLIPDEITVTAPVYDLDETRDSLENVRVLVEAMPEDGGSVTFELTAVLNELRDAEAAAQDEIIGMIEPNLPDGVPLYRGSQVSR